MFQLLVSTLFFVLFSIRVLADSTPIQFLRLDGEIKNAKSAILIDEVVNRIVGPLRANPDVARFTYVVSASANAEIHFHLAVEPKNLASPSLFKSYLASLEGQDFHGLKIHFEAVAKIYEVINLRAGRYVASQEDPFAVSFELPETRDFSSLADWQSFTDAYGDALLSHDHLSFKNYVSGLVSQPGDLSKLSQALQSANMMAIDPRVYLVLEDGATINGEMANSAFVPFQFFRNCFETQYENGFCF